MSFVVDESDKQQEEEMSTLITSKKQRWCVDRWIRLIASFHLSFRVCNFSSLLSLTWWRMCFCFWEEMKKKCICSSTEDVQVFRAAVGDFENLLKNSQNKPILILMQRVQSTELHNFPEKDRFIALLFFFQDSLFFLQLFFFWWAINSHSTNFRTLHFSCFNFFCVALVVKYLEKTIVHSWQAAFNPFTSCFAFLSPLRNEHIFAWKFERGELKKERKAQVTSARDSAETKRITFCSELG